MAAFEVDGVAAGDDEEGGGAERREVEVNVRHRSGNVRSAKILGVRLVRRHMSGFNGPRLVDKLRLAVPADGHRNEVLKLDRIEMPDMPTRCRLDDAIVAKPTERPSTDSWVYSTRRKR